MPVPPNLSHDGTGSQGLKPPPPYRGVPRHEQDYLQSIEWNSMHRHTETDSLLGGHPRYDGMKSNRSESTKRRGKLLWVVLAALSIILSFIVGYNGGYYSHFVSHKASHRKWDLEEKDWALKRMEWNVAEIEHEKQRAEMEIEREKWSVERSQMYEERQHEENARKQRMEEEKKNRGLDWIGLNGAQTCTRYGMRQYTATLASAANRRMSECLMTSVEIHGKEVFPSRCDVQDQCGKATGYWDIDFGESACSPWWTSMSDKGCDRGMHKHRYEARLMNLKTYNNWEALCQTTPTAINGVHYDGATSCLNLGIFGKYGVWFVDDPYCS